MSNSKRCPRCEQIKSTEEFGSDRTNKDGLNNYCRSCELVRHKTDRQDPAKLARARRATLNHRNNNLFRYRSNYHAWLCRKLGNAVYEISDKELSRLYNSPCLNCGSTESIQMDHVISKKKGGSHGIGNLIPLCATCNLAKNTRSYFEMRMKLEGKRI